MTAEVDKSISDALVDAAEAVKGIRNAGLVITREKKRIAGGELAVEPNGSNQDEHEVRFESETNSSGGVDELVATGIQNLVTLKQASRLAFLAAEDIAEKRELAKSALNSKQLVLQSLLYEKQYLAREIEMSLAFETKTAQAVPLVPIEEFLKSAPSHLLDAIKDVEDRSTTKEHELHLSRLSHEMLLRRSLTEEKISLTEEIGAVKKAILDHKTFLEDLPRRMEGIVSAVSPIQQLFGQSLIERLGRHEKCRSLPDPLYMVYCQLEAYGDAFGGVSLDIIQSNCSPNSSCASASTTDGMEGVTLEENSGNTREQPQHKKRKRENLKTNSSDEYADALKSIGENADKVEINDCGLLVRATLSLPRKKDLKVILDFAYFEKFGVATVEAVGRVGLLANIFPNDTGHFFPNLRVPAAQSASRNIFPEKIPGRPFRWLQWLAGIDSLPLDRDDHRRPSSREIVQAILDRIDAQESLSEQLQVLSTHPHPVPIHPSAKSLFPNKLSTKLIKWVEIDPSASDKRSAETSVSRAAGIPTLFRDTAALRKDAADSSSNWTRFGRRCFHGKFLLPGDSDLEVEAIVQVFADYPQRAPVFTLFPARHEVLLTIQREVNEYPEELYAGDRLSLLCHQLRRLQMCLDIHASASNDSADVSPLSSVEAGFSDRKHRGRDRRLPFVFDQLSRAFVHR